MANPQITLAILKPHVVKNPFAINAIRQIITSNGFQIIRETHFQLNEQMISTFYEEHSKKFFYNRLVTFMRSGETTKFDKFISTEICLMESPLHFSGPIDVLLLTGDDAIARWRTIMGPTKVFKTIYTHPKSIRGQFGLSDTRNACHGSDSMDSVVREVSIFFPDFDVHEWYRQNNNKPK